MEINYLNLNKTKNDSICKFTSEGMSVNDYNMCSTTSDMQALIECISLTTDGKLLTKLFSVLASRLITQPHLRESVVKCYILYDKINHLLSSRQPSKSATALNFLMILAYNEDDEDLSVKQSATQYARNMIRVSGCLKMILQYFTSHNMMHADTWKAVCQCIVECCRGSDINQAHCSHLIPICISKCKNGDVLTFPVLRALLQSNKRNCEYFIDSNGLDIFTRPLLCESTCVQLLAALVQEEPRTAKLLQASSVPEQLIAIVRTQGKFSKIGQWCTVILYYIYGDLKILNGVEEEAKSESCVDKMKIIDEHEVTPQSNFRENKLNSTSTLLNNLLREIIILNKEDNSSLNKRLSHKLTNHFGTDKTATSNFPSNDLTNMKASAKKSPGEHDFQEKSHRRSKSGDTEKVKGGRDSMSSFINSNPVQKHHQETSHLNMRHQSYMDANCPMGGVPQTTFEETTSRFNFGNKTYDYNVFIPRTTSTPRPRTPERSILADAQRSRIHKHSTKLSQMRRHGIQRSQIHKHSVVLRRRSGAKRQRISRGRGSPARSNHGRSVGARIFGALNDTCSTVVNAIKGIIMPQRSSNAGETEESKHCRRSTCNFSFTSYMKQRDAVLGYTRKTVDTDVSFDNFEVGDGDATASSAEDADGNVCKTCNDTLLLKEKLSNNVYLKETIRKLKIGINLYGCDFKKISKVMWRGETFMTPGVLYNLYRKLILK